LSRQLGGAVAVLATAAALTLVHSSPAQALTSTSYFVDAIAGNDSATGLDSTHPWKSLNMINATTFVAGDRILLRAGAIWTGQLWPKGSGASGAPITIDSYGTGNKPRVDGAGLLADAVRLFNQSYWTIRNIEVTNTVPATSTPGENLRDLRGIHVSGDNGQTLNGFVIDAVNVHDVTGLVNWIGGDIADNSTGVRFQTGWDTSKKTGGIVFDTTVANISAPPATATVINDALIQNSTISNTSFAGIVFKQYTGDAKNAAGETIAVATGWGTRTSASDTRFRPHTNVVIRNNYISQSATSYGCNGIYLTNVRGGMIDHNVVFRAGTSGIETYFADNVTIQFNEVYGTIRKAGGADFNGIDTDKGTTGQVVQYNYVHGNGDGILLCQFSFGNVVLRYNVIASNSRYPVYLHSDAAATAKVYNNTIYNTNAFLIYGFGTSLNSTYSITNNIAYSTTANAALVTSPTVQYSHNLYGGAALTVPGSDTSPVVADPRFVSAPIDGPSGTPATGPQLASAYELRVATGSPAVNAGATIASNGGRDYAGTTLYSGAADIGAFELASGTSVLERYTFDALATGTLANGTDGLTVSAAGGTVDVAATPSATDKSARLTRTTDSGATSVSRTFPTPLVGTVTIETNVMREAAYVSGNDYFGVPYIRGSNGLNAISVAVTKNTIAAYSGTTLVTIGSYVPGRWYHVTIVVNIASQTFDLLLDGVLVLDNSTFRNALAGVAQIDYYANSSNFGSVVIDDITVLQT
jgi:hypothetical protein